MWIALRHFILDQQSTFLNDSSYRGFNYSTTTQWSRATDTQNETSQKREADFCPDIKMMSEWESSFLSLSFPAIRLITFDADGPAPPVQEKTSGLKVACSTSRICCSYFSFFICSCILYAPPMSFGHILAWGLKIFTSKKVFENLFSHRPFARMSRRASSSVVVVLFAKASPCKVWRQGSISTSSHTSFRRFAKESRMSLCLMWV